MLRAVTVAKVRNDVNCYSAFDPFVIDSKSTSSYSGCRSKRGSKVQCVLELQFAMKQSCKLS